MQHYTNHTSAIIPETSHTTYQIITYVKQGDSSDKLTKEHIMNKCVIYVLDWLKRRIISAGEEQLNDNVAEFLKTIPDYEDYKSFDVEAFSDIPALLLYNIKTIYLEEEKSWAIRIKEPDNLSDFVGKNFIVLGRTYITDIAIKEFENYVRIAVRIACREPQGEYKRNNAKIPSFIARIAEDDQLRIYDSESMIECHRLIKGKFAVVGRSDIRAYAEELLSIGTEKIPTIVVPDKIMPNINEQLWQSELFGFARVLVCDEKSWNTLFKANLNIHDEIEEDSIAFINDKLGYTPYTIGAHEEQTLEQIRLDALAHLVKEHDSTSVFLFYKKAKEKKYEKINSSDPESLVQSIRELEIKLEEAETENQRKEARIKALDEKIEGYESEQDLKWKRENGQVIKQSRKISQTEIVEETTNDGISKGKALGRLEWDKSLGYESILVAKEQEDCVDLIRQEIVDIFVKREKHYMSRFAKYQVMLSRRDDLLRHVLQVNELINQNKINGISENAVITYGKGIEFYPGEIRDIILDEINRIIQDRTFDKKKKKRFESILEANGYDGKQEERITEFTNGMNGGYRHHNENDSLLGKYGITPLPGKDHAKYAYYGDRRYTISTASTPRDRNTGKNTGEMIAFICF